MRASTATARRELARAPEDELRRLRTGEETEGDEARPQAARDVERRGRPAVDPLPVARTQVLQAKLPTREGDADLPAVRVPGEDEVEGARRQPVGDAREVAEEDAEVG